jgi:hypothetical protein
MIVMKTVSRGQHILFKYLFAVSFSPLLFHFFRLSFSSHPSFYWTTAGVLTTYDLYPLTPPVSAAVVRA